jgi:4-aminobutyrate aminotransferase-like enzyme
VAPPLLVSDAEIDAALDVLRDVLVNIRSDARDAESGKG